MTHIKTGDQVALKQHADMKWTVSYVEGNKIYCYRIGEQERVDSIVADANQLIPYHHGEDTAGA
ncbi:MAG: hypothetical protein JWQ38_3443 [Flavipsychrobacter sp.]|nr:hypothetical protein [Flavipsychrobacter sp.]